jgi:hypothetical protein
MESTRKQQLSRCVGKEELLVRYEQYPGILIEGVQQ